MYNRLATDPIGYFAKQFVLFLPLVLLGASIHVLRRGYVKLRHFLLAQL